MKVCKFGKSSLKWWCIAVLWVAVALLGHNVRADLPAESPRITLSTTEIDLGEVKPIDGHERRVEIQNTGTSTLKIGPIVPLCTCVQVAEGSFEVAAGGTKALNIRAMLASYPSNEIKGSIRLHTNDLAMPEVDIQVRGTILPEYIIVPAEVDFGKVKAGEKIAHSFIVRQTGDTPLLVERVETSEGLTALVETAPIVAESKEPTARQFSVSATLSADLDPGRYTGTLTLFTNIPRLPTAVIKVNADIQGNEFSVSPRVLAFGTASPGDQLGDFVVEGNGIAGLEAETDHKGIVLNVVEAEPGIRYRVEVKAKEDLAIGTVVGLVTLRAAGESLPHVEMVHVFGRME